MYLLMQYLGTYYLTMEIITANHYRQQTKNIFFTNFINHIGKIYKYYNVIIPNYIDVEPSRILQSGRKASLGRSPQQKRRIQKRKEGQVMADTMEILFGLEGRPHTMVDRETYFIPQHLFILCTYLKLGSFHVNTFGVTHGAVDRFV